VRTVVLALIGALAAAPVAAQSSLTTAQAAQFLEQSTFGPSAAEVTRVTTVGVSAWLDAELQKPVGLVDPATTNADLRRAVFLSMVRGDDQLRQRVVFALGQTLVVSSSKFASDGVQMAPWVNLLRTHAFGNYRDLIEAVTLNPAMGVYLDLVYSRRATATTSPNENYARELLQLFSIGLWELNQDGTWKLDASSRPIPTYTQTDIRQLAEAMTGWTFPGPEGRSNPATYVGSMVPGAVSAHDARAKTVMGTPIPAGLTTRAEMTRVLDVIANHPNVGPFIGTRLIRSLVTSNPSPAYVARVSAVFNNNGQGVRGDLAAVIRAVLTDVEALTLPAGAGRLKDPVLHMTGLIRAMGAPVSDQPDSLLGQLSALGQNPLAPATVFSFYSPLTTTPNNPSLVGPEFQIYPPALSLQRANTLYWILNGNMATNVAPDLSEFIALASTPAVLVSRISDRLMFGRMTQELRELITSATTAVPATEARQRAVGALFLAAVSSEYSVYANNSGAGAPTLQPPTGLTTTGLKGTLVTLRWTPPGVGPAPAGYLIEGGPEPGTTVASVTTAPTVPLITLDVPVGQYNVRVSSLDAEGRRSRPSADIRLFVGVPAGPTAPVNLLGLVRGRSAGNSVSLSWRNTFGGGAPDYIALDVLRDGVPFNSFPLPVSESFTFDGVPNATYTFSVRAVNRTGSSGSSNAVTLTFDDAVTSCSGAPSMPMGLTSAVHGHMVTLSWQAAASGRPATGYRVLVNGPSGASTINNVTDRIIRGPVAPGTYSVRVQATNLCGVSTATAARQVIVR